MKAIYSYKILDKFWKQRTEDFFKLAKLSVEYTGRIYPTVLYTDKASKKIFDENEVFFDEYIIDEEFFATIHENNYGAAKFVVFLKEKSPYITLDLDTIIFNQLNTTNSITYGYKEIDFALTGFTDEKQAHFEYLEKYYWKYFMLVESEFKERRLKMYTDTYPSNSLIVVNNPNIMRESAKLALELINEDFRRYTVQFYEQYLVYVFLRNYSTDLGFMYDENPKIDFEKKWDLADAMGFKFLHLDRYDRSKDLRDLIDKLYADIVG